MLTIDLILPTPPAAHTSGTIAIAGQLWPYTVRTRKLTGLLDLTIPTAPNQPHQQIDLVNGLGGWQFACPLCWQTCASVIPTSAAAPLAMVCAVCAGKLPN